YDAVAELLEMEAALASGDRQAELVAELARIRDDVLLDDAGAYAAYERLSSLRPGDSNVEEALERIRVKREKGKDLAQKYYAESKTANGPSFKGSLLVSAAEIAYRYGRPELEARARAAEGDDASRSKKKKRGPQKFTSIPPKEGKGRDLLEKIIGLLRDAL